MIVLDTNVLSETLRPKPDAAVASWLKAQRTTDMHTTTICEAEIFYGVALLPAGKRRAALEQMAAGLFDEDFAGRVLTFDSSAARSYAGIVAARRKLGRPIGELDAQIAAIAHAHGATVATRNIDDFADCGVRIVSPWIE
jgi:predicted nucleic acid-binding protein